MAHKAGSLFAKQVEVELSLLPYSGVRPYFRHRDPAVYLLRAPLVVRMHLSESHRKAQISEGAPREMSLRLTGPKLTLGIFDL